VFYSLLFFARVGVALEAKNCLNTKQTPKEKATAQPHKKDFE